MQVTQETLESYVYRTIAALDQWEANRDKVTQPEISFARLATQHEISFARLLIEANEIIIGLIGLYHAARGNITE